MGSTGSKSGRVVLSSNVGVHLRDKRLEDAAEVVSGWLDGGSLLALSPETFGKLLALPGSSAEAFFSTFDTDQNMKVDALEVLSAAVILAQGPMEKKAEVLIPVFDFAKSQRLSFDEANILVHSVHRGAAKLCSLQLLVDEDTVEVCRRMFDSHNLPYSGKITGEEIRRWLSNDVEATRFLSTIEGSCTYADIEAMAVSQEEAMVAAFRGVEDGASAVPVERLRCPALLDAMGKPSEKALGSFERTLSAAAENGAAGSVSPERFARVARSWSAFAAIDEAAASELGMERLPLLLRLLRRQLPSDEEVRKSREALAAGAAGPERISLSKWLDVSPDL
mmetsp:Transcript_54451/g.117876  ORF Transcript_54451/g.117876 Transcript_54451/m.117876 type:complete len:336 (-) Transcript_54451:66-1073(-)